MKGLGFKVRVELVFHDVRHNTRCKAILAADDIYSLDYCMYEAISQLGLRPEPNDKFEIISYKVFNLSYSENSAVNLPPLDAKRYQI